MGCHFLLQGNNSTQKIKILFFKTSWNFFSNIFNLKLFESANVEPRDTYIQRATYINTHKHTHTQISVSSVAQSCLTLCSPVDCSPPGSSIHGILQARILEWVAISFSRGIFLTQGSNPGLPHCRQTLYPLSHQGSSSLIHW